MNFLDINNLTQIAFAAIVTAFAVVYAVFIKDSEKTKKKSK